MKRPEVNLLDFSTLSSTDLDRQQGETGTTIEKFTPELLNIMKPYADWKTGYSALRAAIKIARSSLRTEKIADCDKECGIAYRAINSGIKTAQKHFDPKVREAAKPLAAIVKTYGKITDEPLDRQMSLVDNCMLDFDKFAEEIEITGIGDWVLRLKEKNNEMKTLNSERIDDNADKNAISLKDARKNIISLYKDVCTVIAANVILEGPEKYEPFIRTLNAANAKFGAGKKTTPPSQTTPSETPSNEDESEGNETNEPVVEETHEEKLAKARAFSQINEGEWKNGDYCWHLVNSVKTYWKLLDATQKTVKPYMSGGEAVWEKVS